MDRRTFLAAIAGLPLTGGRGGAQAPLERLGASTACLAGLSLLDAIARLERLGFGTIEMIAYTGARHSVGDIPGFAYDQASPAERERVFDATRAFRHVSAHLPFADVRLFGPDLAERRSGLARLERAIDGLAFLRGEMAVMHLGQPGKGRGFRDIWGPMVDTLRSLGDYAAKHGVKLGIETMQPDSVRDYAEVIAATDHANVGAVIDTGHIRGATDIGLPAERRDTDEARARFNDVLERLILAVGPAAFHVHVSDVRRTDWGDHREIGTGIIDFPRVFRALRRIDYKGLYVLELEEQDTIGALTRSRDRVQSLIAGG